MPRSRVLAAFACALVLSLTLVARAQDKEGMAEPDGPVARLPLNPFAASAEGDWSVVVLSTVSDEDRVPRAEEIRGYEVSAVGSASVQLTITTAREGGPADRRLFFLSVERRSVDRQTAPALGDFPWPRSRVTDVVVVDDRRRAGERELACRKVTYSAEGEKVTLWLSADVKGSGIVEMRLERDDASHTVRVARVVGVGSKGKTDWGQTFDEARGLGSSGPGGKKK